MASVDDVLKALGRRLRAVREAADLTQEEVAGRAGIDYKRLQRIESGQVNVTVRTLHRLAVAMNVTFWEVAAREQAPRRRS